MKRKKNNFVKNWENRSIIQFRSSVGIWILFVVDVDNVSSILQCDQIWRNFVCQSFNILKVFGNCLRANIIFSQMLFLLRKFLYALGHILITTNGLIWKIYVAIWSHCLFVSLTSSTETVYLLSISHLWR